jgi:polyhydroxyalkanoate synthesis repressor PhaR
MRIIKRYPNRKLYDTEEKKYIQLKGIAELIRNGAEIQVFDHASGEDLTTQILTQVIAELERTETGSLPRSLLTGLIRTGSDRLNALQRNLLGQIGLWRQVDLEIHRRIQSLVDSGQIDPQQGNDLFYKLASSTPGSDIETQNPTDTEIEKIIDKRGVPTKSAMDQLMFQLDSLLEKLEDYSSPPPSKIPE